MTFKKEDELVLVVPRDKLFDNEKLTFQGSTSDSNIVDAIMDNIDKYYTSMRRGGVNETDVPKSKNAELNFDYKQPIPYIVIRRKGFYFVTERLSKGGEARLHGKLAMGVGGHMNPIGIEGCNDLYSFKKVLEINTRREIEEELSISQKDFEIKLIGLINDDSDTVGKVHIGILGIIDLDLMTGVNVIETDQLAGQWISLYPLKHDHYEKLENWGKIVVDLLFNYESDR
ncbi:hypothetical protein [Bacillus velezensis]|uniref:hypothetical protein n=1 Tax=Bacillus velezensis TaxID=492670 RepID=UPI00119CFE98|nr:hypothetical protein [Bacillus velezensis]